MPDDALTVENVTKSFGGVAALNDVSIGFPRGTVTAVMGDNGAGKSTLMKVLAGVHTQDSGTLRLNGRPVTFRSPADARAAGIETVHQDLALAEHRDIAANLFLGRELTRDFGPLRFLATKRMRAEATESLADLGVEIPTVRREIRLLSGGQRQAIAIARAVHFGCDILLMDEPMAALGLREAGKVKQLILDLKERGITQVVVSHNLDHSFAVADRIVVFRLGKVAGEFDAADTDRQQVLHLINGLPAAV